MTAFSIGDYVRKRNGSAWEGYIVGTYSTALTPEGYCVESGAHPGSVQIYPAAALELAAPKVSAPLLTEIPEAELELMWGKAASGEGRSGIGMYSIRLCALDFARAIERRVRGET